MCKAGWKKEHSTQSSLHIICLFFSQLCHAASKRGSHRVLISAASIAKSCTPHIKANALCGEREININIEKNAPLRINGSNNPALE
jgi:hypothetical protein